MADSYSLSLLLGLIPAFSLPLTTAPCFLPSPSQHRSPIQESSPHPYSLQLLEAASCIVPPPVLLLRQRLHYLLRLLQPFLLKIRVLNDVVVVIVEQRVHLVDVRRLHLERTVVLQRSRLLQTQLLLLLSGSIVLVAR